MQRRTYICCWLLRLRYASLRKAASPLHAYLPWYLFTPYFHGLAAWGARTSRGVYHQRLMIVLNVRKKYPTLQVRERYKKIEQSEQPSLVVRTDLLGLYNGERNVYAMERARCRLVPEQSRLGLPRNGRCLSQECRQRALMQLSSLCAVQPLGNSQVEESMELYARTKTVSGEDGENSSVSRQRTGVGE